LTVRVNMGRVEEVSRLLKALEPWRVVELEERYDPQYRALRKLASTVGRGWASVYALLVSLVSYRLAMRGEEWWECMASMISARRQGPPPSVEEAVGDVLWFIDGCRGSIVARDARKRRVQAVYKSLKGLLERMASNPDYIYGGSEELVGSLARALGVEEWRKTIVFSVKMIYYAVREPGDRRLLDVDIPIPVDSRVACASYASAIVEARDYREIVSNPRPAQEAWRIVSRNTGIPVVNLDTILWLTGWMPRDLELEETWRKMESILATIIDRSIAREIARGLYVRRC